MKRRTTLRLFLMLGIFMIVCGAVARQKPADKVQPPSSTKASLNDFQWLSGHWEGLVGATPLEEFCSTPDRGLIMCMFRSMDAQKVLALELITLQDTPDGVEERVRFFSPDLSEPESAKTMVLRVTHFAPIKSVFENPNPGGASKVTLTHNAPDEMTARIELLDDSGKPAVIEAHWKRAH